MGAREIDRFLERWEMNVRDLHRRMILALTPRERERERWHSVWLLAQGWTQWPWHGHWGGILTPSDPFDKLRRASAFGEGGPAALIFEETVGSPSPPPLKGVCNGRNWP